MHPNALNHLIGTTIVLVLFVGVVALLFWTLLLTFDRIERLEADREAERLFLERWDRCKSTELATWVLLLQELETSYESWGQVCIPAPKVLQDAVYRRLEEARRRHAQSRVIRLRRGREIVTTTDK